VKFFHEFINKKQIIHSLSTCTKTFHGLQDPIHGKVINLSKGILVSLDIQQLSQQV
jgi:hypothetical protein